MVHALSSVLTPTPRGILRRACGVVSDQHHPYLVIIDGSPATAPITRTIGAPPNRFRLHRTSFTLSTRKQILWPQGDATNSVVTPSWNRIARLLLASAGLRSKNSGC